MIDITERDYDLLVDTQIVVDVILGNAQLTLRDFLNLSEGDVITLDNFAGGGGDIYVNTRIIGTGDIIVIDEKLAVRLQDAMDSDNVVRYFFEEQMI